MSEVKTISKALDKRKTTNIFLFCYGLKDIDIDPAKNPIIKLTNLESFYEYDLYRHVRNYKMKLKTVGNNENVMFSLEIKADINNLGFFITFFIFINRPKILRPVQSP